MKKVLVMGISGGFGGHVAQALVRQGWAIRALMREPTRLPARFAGAEVMRGDAANYADVSAAAQGVDLIVYGVNPANYHWDGKVLPWLDNTAQVAQEQGLTVVFPGNVYVLQPEDGPEFSECAPLRGVTSKGEMRLAMEQRLQQAADNGARVIIIRCGDFIGAYAPSTWMGHLIKRNRHGMVLQAAGPVDIKHTWAYLPDVARSVAELVDMQQRLPAYSVFHFKGYQISFNELAAALRRVTGQPVQLKKFPWWIMRLAAPVSALCRGLVDMRYLWNQEINLGDDKLRKVLADSVPQTPLEQALLDSGLVQQSKLAHAPVLPLRS